jgi:hypothetical protein
VSAYSANLRRECVIETEEKKCEEGHMLDLMIDPKYE